MFRLLKGVVWITSVVVLFINFGQREDSNSAYLRRFMRGLFYCAAAIYKIVT